MLEPSILGKHNRREQRNRLEFATLLTVQRGGGHMKAKLALGMSPGLALLTHTAGHRCRQVCNHVAADSVGGT
jgi:hypothetical protein